MKLLIAILSSILLTCSVTVANPTIPTATTSTEYSTSTVLPSATTDAASSPLASSVAPSNKAKALLKSYIQTQQTHDEAKRKHALLETRYGVEIDLITELEEILEDFERKYRKSKQGSNHNNKLLKARFDCEFQSSKLIGLTRELSESEYGIAELSWKLYLIAKELVALVFGEILDKCLINERMSYILSSPIVVKQIAKVYDDLPQNPQHSNPSSSYEEATSSGTCPRPQRASSRIKTKVMSFFKQS
ncbi:hypothetical protein BDEG_20765 [Batrachochytrium dendrobatidis JEL423]|uniref:Uncharacterized protein n=1 Tax=Batrachochytrium dendrobatidis (strain JEL423) TaxID=403673 RepID=A0A177W929_BATDL|nr:hypothetical protein BDEG_20765 [Batrachochytrium dendrobatidis JEL423]